MTVAEQRIFRFLDSNGAEYEVIEHPAVYTCTIMARLLKTGENSIAKSMITKNNDGGYLLAVLPGSMKVDFPRLAKGAGVKSSSLASLKEAELVAGCAVGCVYPFGNLMNIPTYFDRNLLDSKYVFFNPGSHNKSVRIRTEDLRKLSMAELKEFAV